MMNKKTQKKQMVSIGAWKTNNLSNGSPFCTDLHVGCIHFAAAANLRKQQTSQNRKAGAGAAPRAQSYGSRNPTSSHTASHRPNLPSAVCSGCEQQVLVQTSGKVILQWARCCRQSWPWLREISGKSVIKNASLCMFRRVAGPDAARKQESGSGARVGHLLKRNTLKARCSMPARMLATTWLS